MNENGSGTKPERVTTHADLSPFSVQRLNRRAVATIALEPGTSNTIHNKAAPLSSRVCKQLIDIQWLNRLASMRSGLESSRTALPIIVCCYTKSEQHLLV
jgi:hypothetical protein